MAKTIKFNLICDKKPVRTIEDLQNNFSIEDVLAYYNNKLLHRWLKVRGYDLELEAVSAITSDDPMEIIKELIQIFDVVTDEKKVEESIYMLEYLEERKDACVIYEQENYKVKNIIGDYESGYRQLVEKICDYPHDAALIKANIAEIVSNYSWILRINYRELYWRLEEQGNILAIMCLLMNSKSRRYYVDEYTDAEDGDDDLLQWLFEYHDVDDIYKSLCHLIKDSDFKDRLKGNLISFSGMTDGYWKDLEPKGKKYMIISMEDGDYVRSAGHSGGDLSSADILNNFVILDGIDYKSNSSTHELCYMEV